MHSDEVTASQSLVVKQIRSNSGQHTAQPVIHLSEHAHGASPGPTFTVSKAAWSVTGQYIARSPTVNGSARGESVDAQWFVLARLRIAHDGIPA